MDKLAVMKGKAQKVRDMKKKLQSIVTVDALYQKKIAEVSDSLR